MSCWFLNKPMNAVLLIGFMSLLLSQQQAQGATVAERSQELQQTQEKLNAALKKITELETELAKYKELAKTDEDRLDEIELPDLADPKAVAAYIDEIMNLSKDKTSLSSGDLEMIKFKLLGQNNVPILFKKLYQYDFHYYLKWSIINLVDERHKDLVITAMEKDKDFVSLVHDNHWQEDARDVLLRVLQTRPTYLPKEWIACVVALNDPAAIDDLKWYLVNGAYEMDTYARIKDIPGIDIKDEVIKLWGKLRYEHPFYRSEAAAMAASYGNIEALTCLFEDYLDDKIDASNKPKIHTALKSLLGEQYLLHRDHKKWIQHIGWIKDEIQFDPVKKQFILPAE